MRLKSHTLIATLLTAALMAPAAQAMPIDPVTQPRVADARTETGQLPGPPTWPMDPKPINAVKTEPTTTNGFPWETIAIAVAGAGLALTVGRMLTGARRRPHVAA